MKTGEAGNPASLCAAGDSPRRQEGMIMNAELFKTLGVVFLTVFIAEMGDKTQLLMVAMAKKYRVRDIVIGVGLSIIVLNLMAVALGSLIGDLLPTMFINLAAGIAFFYFATSALLTDSEEETVKGGGSRFGAIASTFGIFFLGELGDKTQLTALALSAEQSAGKFSFPNALMVFLGATLALYAADAIGLIVGYFLGKSIPNWVFGWLSYVLFAAFGVMKLLDGFGELFGTGYLDFARPLFWEVLCTAIPTIIFVVVSMTIKFRRMAAEEKSAKSEGNHE